MTKPEKKASKSDTKRFLEILNILRKHEIARDFNPVKLRLILEDLGPTFIKLGQILSMRPDILPENYCTELTKLRSEVSPMSFEDVRTVIEHSCGNTLEEMFESFEMTPLGSASIAQAHLAKRKDGDIVVVKVQRIGIFDTMARDISLLRRASGILKIAGGTGDVIDFKMALNELWIVAQEEMDFLTEAKNAEEFYDRNRDLVFISCPRIYRDFTTSKVLVMEYIDGFSINNKEALTENGYDLNEIGEKLANNYMKQVIEDGFFHADPHPGNIKIRDGQIVWIDMGMMGRLSIRDQKLLGKAIRAVAHHDIGIIKDVVLTLGVCKNKSKLNHSQLYNDIDDMLSRYGSLDLGGMNLAVVIADLLGLAKSHEISMPSGITMLTRGIATIEGVIADISPSINLIEITANRMAGSLFENFDIKKELAELSRKGFESGRKSLDIPAIVSDILKMTIKGQTKINMELHSSDDLYKTTRKIADKLITGILVAALLIGSSLLCTTDMQPKLLDIPALGAVGYFVAIILCIQMILNTYKNK